MIKAMMFDMDGVLVQNEKLKALSVAMAVQRLRGLPEPDPTAIPPLYFRAARHCGRATGW